MSVSALHTLSCARVITRTSAAERLRIVVLGTQVALLTNASLVKRVPFFKDAEERCVADILDVLSMHLYCPNEVAAPATGDPVRCWCHALPSARWCLR